MSKPQRFLAIVTATIFIGIPAIVWSAPPPTESAAAAAPAPTAAKAPAPAPVAAAPAPAAPAPNRTDLLEKRLADLEDRLDQVERKSILDHITFAGDYRVMLNTFYYHGPSPDPYDLVNPQNPMLRKTITSTTEEVWSQRFRLTLKTEPLPTVRITGRLVMFHNFGDSDATPLIFDFASSRVPRDSAIRFDQIWGDWFITPYLAFSAGRIAYAEGNPAELRDNSDIRQATWGTHMVDGEYETLNLTFNFGPLVPSLEGLYVRLFYASWFFDNDDVLGGFPFLESGENLRILGGNIEFKIPQLGRNFFQFGYYAVPQFRPFPVPIPDPAYDPKQNHGNLPSLLNGSLLFPNAGPDSLGTYQNISGLIEFYDIAGSGIDFFFAGALGLLSPNDKALTYNMMDATGQRNPVPFLVLASKGDDGLAYFLYTGFRFTIPSSYKAKIGFEFNYGSRYWISFAQPTDQLLAKLAVRGKAYETYLLLPIGKNFHFRITYLYIDTDQQSGFFGPNPAVIQQMMQLPELPKTATSPDWDQKIHSIQISLAAKI